MRVLVSMLYVLLVACGPPSSTAGSSASRCSKNQDCSASEECYRGLCVPNEEQSANCVVSSDCRQGQRCQHGSCLDQGRDCRVDQDCPQGQDCDNGLCFESGSDCLRNADCPEGQACQRGACVSAQNTDNGCRVDRDCAEGQACRGGQCITQQSGGNSNNDSSGAVCATHDECSFGEACMQPQGRCGRWLNQRCSSHGECAIRDSQGQSTPGLCDQGQCRVTQFGACESNSDCGGTYRCMTAGRNQMCLQGCQDSSVCDSNLKCDDEISACWYNLCGQPHELSDRYQQVSNGDLGGSCDADGGGDGTCVEVEAGPGQWVGLCIEGGHARVGDSCLFDAQRTDDRNQCQGGSLCHFDNDRERGVCVASCSPDSAHGSVRCTGSTTCVAGRCLSRDQQCDPGAQDACGSTGRCSLLSWGTDQGMCAVQAPQPGPPGTTCDKSTQCVDGSICLTLRRGEEAPSCHALCRPGRGGQACPGDTRCTSLAELSSGQVVSSWGLCVPASN